MDGLPAVDDAGDINLANALDLSESEEEEEMENIIVDFAQEREEVNDFALHILRQKLTFDLCRINKACNKSVCTSSSSQHPSLLSFQNYRRLPIKANQAMHPGMKVSASRFQPIRNLLRPCPRTWTKRNRQHTSMA